MRANPIAAATLVLLGTACGSGKLSRGTAEKLIRPDYPAVAPLRVPRTATVDKGTPTWTMLQTIHAALQQDGRVQVQTRDEGTKATFTYALAPGAAGAKPTASGFELPAAEVEFVRMVRVETRGNQARATYEVRLARPTALFPAFQARHPGAQIGQTKQRHAEFDKQGGRWGLLKTDEAFGPKD
jgi:hypothetical protein